jgi:hypothetical protein
MDSVRSLCRMSHAFVKLLAAAVILSGSLLNAQSKQQTDPTYHPDPMYSKSQKKKDDKHRMVHGIVKDEQDNPLKGALVNLKNLQTNQTITYITKADGKYTFEELSREQDYEISAAFSGKTTPVKKLSHYDPQMSSMRILSFAEPDDANVQKVSKK